MDNVFIVRPFGKKRPVIKKDKNGNPEIVFVDFDKVEELLIDPAIYASGLKGGTTLKIFETGEIKEDMFSLLLTADIVIADITIHNANVFYELGIRHALRCKTTVLIKGSGFDDTPFDILGYKYIDYSTDNPENSVQSLIKFLKASPAADKKDSPVFNMLPKLQEQATENFLAIPPEFTDEVIIASASKQIGKLSLLAHEAGFFPWKISAYKFIGEELFKLKALEAGRTIWENVKTKNAYDYQANDRLATIYQRLAEAEININPSEASVLLMKSDLAVESLLAHFPELEISKKAEVYALKGRNAKTKWMNTWENSSDKDMEADALQSIFLESAYKNYETGFFTDLNHFYSAIMRWDYLLQ